MIKKFQTDTSKGSGNCMQAAIASLLEKDMDEVPNFAEFEDQFPLLKELIEGEGYKYEGTLHNKNWSSLLAPTGGCFEDVKWYRPSIISDRYLHRQEGVQGYFYAGVLSPHYFDWKDIGTHAVIIDKDYNIVHDPNPEYANIKQYPLADILGYSGVIDVFLINPKEN